MELNSKVLTLPNSVRIFRAMGVTERRNRQKEEVRAKILQTAWQIVMLEGWQSLSIRKIAEAIEYSAPVIYDHFENKDAILLEFIKEGFRLLADQIKLAKDKYLDPAEQLEEIAQAYWSFAFSNKEYYQLMYGIGIPTCEVARKVPEMQRFRNLLQGPIIALIENGKHPEADPFLKFHTFWSILHGLISINMMGKTSASDQLNQLILIDAISGFISSMKG